MQLIHLLAVLALTLYFLIAVFSATVSAVLFNKESKSILNERLIKITSLILPKLIIAAKAAQIFLVISTFFKLEPSGYFYLWMAFAVDFLGESFAKRHLILRFIVSTTVLCLISSSSYLAHADISYLVSPYEYPIILYLHIFSSVIGFTFMSLLIFSAAAYLAQDFLLRKNFALALNIKLPSQTLLYSFNLKAVRYTAFFMSLAIFFGVLHSLIRGQGFFQGDFITYLGFFAWVYSVLIYLILIPIGLFTRKSLLLAIFIASLIFVALISYSFFSKENTHIFANLDKINYDHGVL
jgi:hypothetical protein